MDREELKKKINEYSFRNNRLIEDIFGKENLIVWCIMMGIKVEENTRPENGLFVIGNGSESQHNTLIQDVYTKIVKKTDKKMDIEKYSINI